MDQFDVVESQYGGFDVRVASTGAVAAFQFPDRHGAEVAADDFTTGADCPSKYLWTLGGRLITWTSNE